MYVVNRAQDDARSRDGGRLDPHALPQRFRYDTGLAGPAAEAAVVLDRDMACVNRVLPSGIPMSLRMKIAAFEGVAARVVPSDGGQPVRVVVELMHRDPQLSLPLLVAADMDEVVADWQAWAATLALPLILVEADGTTRRLRERIGTVELMPVKPRRHRSVLRHRRPRFLMRRKPGKMPAEPVFVTGREITAWDESPSAVKNYRAP